MCKGPLLLLWLVMELGCLFLQSATSELTVTGLLGQSVTLPCLYSSWSRTRNSMCWGKGSCPKSKCGQQLVHTDGAAITSSKSARYSLRGNIQRGNLSLTISKTTESDSGVYCCRIEVPGWFNDVKNNIHLELVRAPTTTTSSRPTTTRRVTTTTTPRVTTATTTPDLTTGTPLQTRTTSILTMTTTTTCPLTMSSSLPEGSTGLLPTDTVTEGRVITEGSEVFPLPSDSSGSTRVPSAAPSLLTADGSRAWAPPSTSQEMAWTTNIMKTSARGVPEKSVPVQSEDEPSEGEQIHNRLIVAVAAGLGFLLLTASLLAFLFRGKVTQSNCLQKHKRPDHAGERQDILNDAQRAEEDADGLFTL